MLQSFVFCIDITEEFLHKPKHRAMDHRIHDLILLIASQA